MPPFYGPEKRAARRKSAPAAHSIRNPSSIASPYSAPPTRETAVPRPDLRSSLLASYGAVLLAGLALASFTPRRTPPPAQAEAPPAPAPMPPEDAPPSAPTPPRPAALKIRHRPNSPLIIKRMSDRTEADLRAELNRAPEVTFDRSPEQTEVARMVGAVAAFAASGQDCEATTFAMLERRRDLEGLPFLKGAACRIDTASARALALASPLIRAGPARDSEGVWRRPESLPALQQITMGESSASRLPLMARLAAHAAPGGAAALARHAVFDPSPDVREEAIKALRGRPEGEYLDALLAGFRHPWPAAAQHAAEALAALAPVGALPALLALLDAPDPRYAPDRPGHPVTSREMVRVNHLANCLLCHAPSMSSKDIARGRVPAPNDGPSGPEAYYKGRAEIFVRADITYLRQDFSALLPVQRFDFLVRERPTTRADREAILKERRTGATVHQRAVMFALCELTGEDHGTEVGAWRTRRAAGGG